MPYRKIPLVTGQIYHVFNRSIAKQPIFTSTRDYQRVTETINFYRYPMSTRYSHFKNMSSDSRKSLMEAIVNNTIPIIDILGFCFMPNHLHFLLRQNLDNSISNFMRNIQHSYSNYFNLKNKRTGSLFQSMFKAVLIESDNQLVHVSRYIHLNPATSHIIKIQELENYPWSSLKDYLNNSTKGDNMVETKTILIFFKSREGYRKFVFDQADYQKELDKIKHLALE